MTEAQDVIDMANFYEISEFDLFYLAYLWYFVRIPDFYILKIDYKYYIAENKIPFYVRQFIMENPLIDDNGLIIEDWLPILESLRNNDKKEVYLATWTKLAKRRLTSFGS